jgi:tetratricopeptide (TPR) repeat protein
METRLQLFSLCRNVLAFAALFLSMAFVTHAQNPPTRPLGGPASVPGVTGYGSVVVYLRAQDGAKLPEQALPTLTISADVSDMSLPNQPQKTGDGWIVTGLPMGNEYHVIVSAIGYQTAREAFEIPQIENAVTNVVVFLKPVDQDLTFRPPAGNFVLAPKAQKEIQHAVQDLQQGNISSARKHCEKALQLAPGNPYVQYVTGMAYLLSKDFESAKSYLEKSVSLDPTQPVALAALGGLLYSLSDDKGAIDALTKAVSLDPSSWKSEWYLACSYLRQRKFQESKNHAQQALKMGKKEATLAQMILGEAEANLGERDAAIATFEKFVDQNPSDPNTKVALHWIEILRTPAQPAAAHDKTPLSAPIPSSTISVPLPLPPVETPPPEDWAPKDVDAIQPFVLQNASCSLPKILESAGRNAENLVHALQEFSATEEFQEVEVRRTRDAERPVERSFNYLVFIDQISNERFDVREFRTDGTSAAQFPGRLMDMGAPALAMAFHPSIQPDLDWKCEGMGSWNDKPAWIVHFEQREDKPNVLAAFASANHSYALALKGRAWLSQDATQVLHLETDLREEIKPINLKREHFSIDYKLVSFHQHNVALWLPESVDTYIQYQGHFLHHYHHFTDFKLFWVGATQKINDPKEATQQ